MLRVGVKRTKTVVVAAVVVAVKNLTSLLLLRVLNSCLLFQNNCLENQIHMTIRLLIHLVIIAWRFRQGGGVALYVRNTVRFKSPHDLPKKSIELITIDIKPQNSNPFIAMTWYRPLNKPNSTSFMKS